jgi:hypothetical protein
MPAFDVARRWTGRVMLDRAGAKIGASMRLVPIGQAVEGGNEIRVPYHRAFVEAAPGMGAGGRLWPQEQEAFYGYYGLPDTSASLVDLDEDDDEQPLEVEKDAAVARGGRWPDPR